MANPIHNPTLKKLAAPMLDQHPLCIQLPATGAGFVLKSGLIHLLRKFHRLGGEDSNKQLKEFHIVFASMKPIGENKLHLELSHSPWPIQQKSGCTTYFMGQSLHGLKFQ